MVELQFPPLGKFGSYKVYVYANDIDHNVVECHQLNILCVA